MPESASRRSRRPGNGHGIERNLSMVRTCILTGYGINADYELAEAFESSGAVAERVHVGDLIRDPTRLDRYSIAAFPGGFSFGDHLGSGLALAHVVKQFLRPALEELIERGGLIIGICNGFQVLVKCGLLPNLEGGWRPEVSLIHNDSGVFEDSWVTVRFEPSSPCVWTEGLDTMDLPIRHGEGRFVAGNPEVRSILQEESLIALRYAGRNPNGSEMDAAGITDRTGRILGLMPHPEAAIYPEQHAMWTRERRKCDPESDSGLSIFRNGVQRAE